MPPAARVSDMTVCPENEGSPPALIPHVGGPILPPGCTTVLIGGMPAAITGGKSICIGPPADLDEGSPTVLIDNEKAVRLGDSTSHSGVVTVGCPTVLIGTPGSGAALAAAASNGTALCEMCSGGS